MPPLTGFHLPLVLACWVLCVTPGRAYQVPQGRLPFLTCGTEVGLHNQAVTCMAQDAQGFLWVGTQGSLFRFDGRSFQAFGMKEGLPSGSITALAVAPDRSLWVGTFRGLARLEGDRFQPVPLPPMPVHAIRVRGSELWIAMASGLFRTEHGNPAAPVPGWTGEARALWLSKDGTIWASRGASLFQGRPGGPWEPRVLPGPPERILDLVEDPSRRMIIRTPSRLWSMGPEGCRDLRPPITAAPSEDARMEVDALQRLWLPTNAGLWVMKEGRWEALGLPQGLPTASPNTVLLDREGSLWVGGQGVHRLQGRGLWSLHGEPEGLPHAHTWGIARDPGGTLWVATNAGLAWSDGRAWRVVAGTSGQFFRALAPRQAGGVRACGPEGQLLAVTPGSRPRREDQGLPPSQGLAILEDRKGTLWVGTRHEGLWCRPPGQRSFQPVGLPGGIPHERIGALAEGPEGSLWVAGASGLARLREGRWTRFTTRNGLKHDHVDGVRPTRGGQVLVSYYEPLGFTRMRPVQDRLEVVRHEDTRTGLASDMVYFLGEDSQGRVWVGTGRGVDILYGGHIAHHGKLQGLAGEDCNAGAFLAEPDGRVWIGTSTGLSTGHGNWDEEEPAPPTILLSAALGNRPLSLAPAHPSRVPHDAGDLQVQFAIPSFLRQAGMESRYRLLGSSDAWRVARSTELLLPTLSHGDYTLEVQSRSPRGAWGAPARLSFTIAPAWWQPWWVKVLAGLALTAGLSRLVQRQWRRLRKRNMELETLLNLADQLTRELEAANLALQQESTTDPLTGLRNRRYLDSNLGNDLAHVERAYRTFQEQGLEGAPPNADLVFMIVDIDHFKRVNDTYGHRAGDAVLQQFAELLRSATRGSDTIIRWGGEEFLIEARHSQRRDIPIVAERIRRSVEDWPFVLPDGQVIHCTCSQGFAPYPFATDHALSWSEVVDLADQCLYRAKATGRNRWVGHVTQHVAEAPALESLPPQ